MWELRFVAIHEDGQHLVVSSPDFQDEAFLLPLTDELRDAVAAPAATVARPAVAYGEPLTPREIQTRVRAGENADQIAAASGLPLARIERFAGPVLAERAHVADEARAARPAGQVDDVSRTLAEIVDPRLTGIGADPELTTWDSWRRDDAVWTVQLVFASDGERQTAEWTWDPARRQLRSYGAAARALMAPTPVEPAEPATTGRPAPVGPDGKAAGLRMVPPRPKGGGPAEPAGTSLAEAEAEALSIEAHPAGRSKKARPSEDPEGVGKRATVPSWDDIMFGVRRPDEAN